MSTQRISQWYLKDGETSAVSRGTDFVDGNTSIYRLLLLLTIYVCMDESQIGPR